MIVEEVFKIALKSTSSDDGSPQQPKPDTGTSTHIKERRMKVSKYLLLAGASMFKCHSIERVEIVPKPFHRAIASEKFSSPHNRDNVHKRLQPPNILHHGKRKSSPKELIILLEDCHHVQNYSRYVIHKVLSLRNQSH